MPVKYRDPGCPTVTCTIGSTVIKRALLDLGAGVNLLPYSVYEQLGIGELKPTKVTNQLADRSMKTPRGVVDDVLVKIGKFFFPVDFIVLDTAPVHDHRNQIPVILGRPFLATANALIDCRSGAMKLTFGNMTVEKNIFKFEGQTIDHEEHYQHVNMVYELQGKDKSVESNLEDTPQGCKEICDEVSSIREEEEQESMRLSWRMNTAVDLGESDFEDAKEILEDIYCEELQVIEMREWLVHSGPPIFDTDPNDHIQWRSNDLLDNPTNSVCWDPYIEHVREDHKMLFYSSDKEPSRRELWLNSLNTNMTHDIPKLYYIDDPFERESGYFEQGEWIFDYELRFFENKDSCLRNDDKWKDNGLVVNLVMIAHSVGWIIICLIKLDWMITKRVTPLK